MTEALFRDDSYLRECQATVVDAGAGGIVLDQTVFYPLGGGQPGDTGTISWDGGAAKIVDTRYGDNGDGLDIAHVLEEGPSLPDIGENVTLEIDWQRRYRHMRMHTATHLLGSILKYDVTGGNISTEKSRLDFNMEDTVDKEAVGATLMALVAAEHPVSCRWITEQELDDNQQLVRTMSVRPPRGKGSIRLLEIRDVDGTAVERHQLRNSELRPGG